MSSKRIAMIAGACVFLAGTAGARPPRGVAALTPPHAAQSQACAELPAYGELDFWIGEWDVFVGDQKVGTNVIEKILDGCAVQENWTDADGNEAKSLFYFDPANETWKQVWVTESASTPGGTKEKILVEKLDGAMLRFQGQITGVDGQRILDRTTLTTMANGWVRQLIEQSRDDGRKWTTTFDAVYRPKQ